MYHCKSFAPYMKWLLLPDKEYSDKTLSIGYCPKCHKTVIELKQTRKSDSKMFVIVESGIKAEAIIDLLRFDKYEEIKRNKTTDKPFGWRFGVNILFKNGDIKQFSSDWFGRREQVKILSNNPL